MLKIRILFCRSNNIGSWLIRKLTKSEWSHVAIVLDDIAIEATIPKVRTIPLSDLIREHSAHEVRWVLCPSPLEAWNFARCQVGKRYDFGFLFGWLLRDSHWQNPGQWACSELVAAALLEGGKISPWSAMSRITPQDIYSGSHADQ